MPKPSSSARVQYGVLPYRVSGEGELQFLLITSRRTSRWIVPKGWPIKDCSARKTAEIEALEEAGVSGVISRKPIGSFQYEKLLDKDQRVVLCEVVLFALEVLHQAERWSESGERQTRWLPSVQAAELVLDPGLRRLILEFRAER